MIKRHRFLSPKAQKGPDRGPAPAGTDRQYRTVTDRPPPYRPGIALQSPGR
jgi:hypothetical protein